MCCWSVIPYVSSSDSSAAGRDGQRPVQSAVMGDAVFTHHSEGAVAERAREAQRHRRALLQVSSTSFWLVQHCLFEEDKITHLYVWFYKNMEKVVLLFATWGQCCVLPLPQVPEGSWGVECREEKSEYFSSPTGCVYKPVRIPRTITDPDPYRSN